MSAVLCVQSRACACCVCVQPKDQKKPKKKVGYERHSFFERIYINVYIYIYASAL